MQRAQAGDINLVNSHNSQFLANENQPGADLDSNTDVDRTKRNLGDVNVTLLGNSSESKVYGLISSGARTFVQDGITTEFTTQLIGTNIGNDYAKILSTGSKILYGNLRSKSVNSEPYLIYPTVDSQEFDILPSSVQEINGEYLTSTGDFDLPVLKDILSNSQDDILETSEARNIVSPTDPSERTPSIEKEEDESPKDSRENSERVPDSENVISVKKEYSSSKNNGEIVKPQKVKPKANLPTYTVKNSYDSFLFEDDLITEEPKYDTNQLFRKPVIIKNDINFEAIAKKQQRISKSLLFNRNKDREAQKEKDQPTANQQEKTSEKSKLVTTTYFGFADFTTTVGSTVIHFMPHTPAAVPNSLVTSIKDEATIRNELIRPSKVQNNILKTNVPNSVLGSNKPKHPIESSQAESHEKSSKLKETEPLFKYRSSTTRVYNTEAQALGLVKSIGGIESYEGTTTEFTTFVYGTYINGDYKQLLQSATNIKINPTKTSNTPVESTKKGTPKVPTTTPKAEEENITTESLPESDVKSNKVSTNEQLEGSESAELVAKTSYKTYTYLTTFFIPVNDDFTTTSVKSRDVVSSIVTYVPSTIKPSKAAETIKPSEEVTTPPPPPTTTTPGTTTTTEESREVTSPLPEDSSNAITTESSSESDDQVTTTATVDKISSTTPKNKVETEESKEEEKYTTLDSYETTESVIISTTEKKSSDSVTLPTPTPTVKTEKNEEPEEENEEVELIFKTLYTTYTYLTTYFEESTSTISSREEIVTNVVTSTIDKSFFSDDAVEGLFERNENSLISSDAEKVRGTNLVTSENNTEVVDDKTVYTTFTYFTTLFDDEEPSVTSRTEVVTNIIKPTSIVPENIENTNTLEPVALNQESRETSENTTPVLTSSYSEENVTSSTTEKLDELSNETIYEDSNEDVKNIKPGRPQERKFTYDTTMSRNHNKVNSNDVEDDEESLENFDSEEYSSGLKERDAALSNEENLLKNSYRNEYMVTNINSTRSKETINRKMIILNDSEEDQISSETNTEETEPSLLLQTSYTTFTYFTTLYKGSSSDIISRLETVTNVVTETVQPTVVTENILDLENEDVPITYYTTFTYWTTLYKEGSTMITSREETQSNIITPSVNKITDLNTMEITPTPTMSIDSTSTPTPNLAGDLPEPTTYFTTYTYFTTSYLGNSTIVNSRLETETNVVTPSETIVEPPSVVEPTPELSLPVEKTESTQKLEPTGLISTIAITDVLEGITTILSTDVFGTYIDGLYAQVLESTTKILSSETPSVATEATPASSESSSATPQEGVEVKPTGVVSLNEGSIIDAEGITTTFYTTKAIGTYIDGLYAQVIESTSSIKIDEERKTTLPESDPATTIIGDKSYKTGLVKIIEGQMVKDKTTTFYESKVIGTIIDDRYAQVIESTSSISIEPTVNPDEVIKPTSTQIPELNITPTEQPTTPASTPAVESSQGENKGEDEDDEENKIGSKKKFAPVIRPFASRPRPTFLPKKKTGEPAIAQTITRGITPTIVATPALKATSINNVFGASSRNRFAASRRPSIPSNAPVSENPDNIRPSSSSRKFSRPSKSSGTPVSSFLPSSRRGSGPSSVKVIPTPTPIVSSSRRSPNYRTSAPIRPSPELRSTGPNTRFRVRPTPTSSFTRASTVSTTPEPVEEDEEITNTDEEQDELEEPVVTTTTTESPRRQNPLLRLRRPPLGRTAASPTPPPPPSQNIPTTRATLKPSNARVTTGKPATTTKRAQASNNRATGNRGATTTTSKPTTTRPRPVYNNNNRPRPRPASSLLPGRLPGRKPVEEPKEEEPIEQELDEEKNQALGQIEDEESDNFFDGSETEESKPVKNEVDNKILRKPTSPVSIRPFTRRRNKRQADYGYRYDSRQSRQSNSNKRPAPRIQSSDYYYYDDDVVLTEAPKVRSRFSSRNQQQPVQNQQKQGVQQKITPATTSNFNARQQFTLRESKPAATTPRANYRRPPQSRRQETTTPAAKRPSAPRLKNNYRESPRKSAETRRFNSNQNTRRPPSQRQRFTTENFNNAYVPPIDDGSITVTLKTPTEVTIPVFNGKFTEYKNVLTAKPSFETLGPHQYTSVIGKNGLGTLQYVSDVTETLPNGNTEITKFVILETPTTTVVFTPTTIRGRKTSFSHIVPSTVYDVRPEVSTITPNLGNAPLANLLLSQLLLGNLNLQPTGNPLGVINQAPMTPITEYKTKSTTYVTTVTSISSAVLPLTFSGKEITTTIVESSTQVITATEFMTETVVITPTPVANQGIPAANQLNTLLLPALLQAQLLQQATPTPVTNLLADIPLIDDESQNVNSRLQELQVEEEIQQNDSNNNNNNNEQENNYSKQKVSKKKPSKYEKKQEVQPSVSSSIVTLYVSGKRPGDFSTLLSTVYEDATQRKREATIDVLDMEASDLQPSRIAFFESRSNYDFDDMVMSALNDISVESSEMETQPLETKYLIEKFKTYSSAPNLKSMTVDPHLDPNIDPGEALFDIITFGPSDSQNKNVTGYFLADSPADITPYQQGRAYPRSTKRIVKRDLSDSVHTKDYTIDTDINAERPTRKLVLKKKHHVTKGNSDDVTTWKPIVKKTNRNAYGKSLFNLNLVAEKKQINPDTSKINDTHGQTGNEDTNKNNYEHIAIIEPNERQGKERPSGKRFRVVKRLKTIPDSPNEDLVREETNDATNGKVVKKQLNVQELFKNDASDLDKNKNIDKTKLTNYDTVDGVLGNQDINLARGSLLEGTISLLNEARLNLATKVMSNGVQVIVAGDRTTYPGDNHYRILTANVTRPITLAPSTISNHMVMLLPHETQHLNNQFITKTYLTTYTYLTTFLQNNVTKTTSSEEVISNVVTEDVKNPHSTAPVNSANQITLTSPVDLITQVYHTTYTYLNTLLDEEQPIVLTTKKTILNTVTSLSGEIDNAIETSYDVIQDTNTYINTVQFTKTISDGLDMKVISTQDVLTQVIITQSDKPFGSSPVETIQPSTTDVTKTYFVTYTYFNTIQEANGNTVVTSEIATSSDVVTETFHLQTKRPELEKNEHKKPVNKDKTKGDKNNHKENLSQPDQINVEPTETAMLQSESHSMHIFATKTYLTTYTYFTTLLSNEQTVVNSRTKIIENLITETLASSLLDEGQISLLKSSLKTEDKIVSTATLKSGEKVEITAMNHLPQDYTRPYQPYNNEIVSSYETDVKQTASANLEYENKKKTPVLQTKLTLNKKPVEKTQYQKEKIGATNVNVKEKTAGQTSYLTSSTVIKNGATLLPGTPVIKVTNGDGNETVIPVSDPITKHPDSKPPSGVGMNDLLSLGSLSINSLTALKPVLSAMAGYLKNNLKTTEKYKNESLKVPPAHQTYKFPTFSKNDKVPLHSNGQHLHTSGQHENHYPLRNEYEEKSTPNTLRSSTRAPIYIPLSGLSSEKDIEPQESQIIESNQYADTYSRNTIHSASLKATSEKPLLNGGIPISPGEVITANSDVIVGRPSVLGVRPPEAKKPKDDVPIGMRPPPPPSQGPPVSHKENVFSSSNKNEETKYPPPKFNPLPAAGSHLVEYNDIIPDLRPPAPPILKQKPKLPIRPTKVNNEHFNSHPFHQKPHSGHNQNPSGHNQNNPFSNIQNSFEIQMGAQIYEDHEAHEAPQLSGSQQVHTYDHFENREPVVIQENAPKFVEHSSVDPLLVNLQPSQVANVVIPHGSETALIYSDQGNKHGPKGEVFNEAAPSSALGVKIYSSPPTAVGAVSTNHVYTMNNVHPVGNVHQAVIPNDQMNFNVAVAPSGINVSPDNIQYGGQKIPQSDHREPLQHGTVHNDYLDRPEQRPTPDQRPVSYQSNEQIHIHKKPSHINEEYMGPPPPLPEDFTNDGELIQESNTRPLHPGQVPDELKFKQNNYKSPPPSSPSKPSVEYFLQYGNKKRPQPRPTSEYPFESIKPTGQGQQEQEQQQQQKQQEIQQQAQQSQQQQQQQQQQYHNYEKQQAQNQKKHKGQNQADSQSSEDYEEEQLKLEQEVLNILHQHQEQLNKYTAKPDAPSSEYAVVVNHASTPAPPPQQSNTHLQQHPNQKPTMETHNNEWHEVGHDTSTPPVDNKPEYSSPNRSPHQESNTHYDGTKTHRETQSQHENGQTHYDGTKTHHDNTQSHYDNTKHSPNGNTNAGKVPYHQNGHQIPLSMYDLKYEQGSKPDEGLAVPRPTLNELDIKAQIITGKPEKETAFHGNTQVLSIGKPTLLTPEDGDAPLSHSVGSSISFESKPHSVGSSISFESKPHSVGSTITFESKPQSVGSSISFESKPHSVGSSITFDSKPHSVGSSISFEPRPSEDNSIASSDVRQKVKGTVQPVKEAKPIETNEIKQFTSNEVRPILPSDPTVATMNMDEKIPPPPPSRPKKPELSPSGSKAQDSEVLGMSPPPVQRYKEDIRPTTRRPPFRLRPSKIPRPGSPYKFELPSTSPNTTIKLEKPTPGKIEPVAKWQTSTTKKPINLLRPNENAFPVGLVQSVKPHDNANSPSISLPGIGSSVSVDGNHLRPEVIVAPSKVAMNDIKLPKPSKPVNPPAMQTVVVGQPIAQDVIATDNPTTEWNNGVIIGSESEEPIAQTEHKIKTLLSKTGQTTVFTNLYTKPTIKIKPTRTTVAHHSVISMVIDKELPAETHEPVESSPDIVGVEVNEQDQYQIGNMQGSMTELPTRFVTHTQTLSVTITETTIVQSSGQKPSTHTLVLTKTHTSTMIDTVTEVHTLLKPTKILSTVTTTVPVPVVTTEYAPHFSGSAHPATAHPDLITAPPPPPKKNPHENESILLVVTDKKPGTVPIIERPIVDIQVPDETNEINPNDVLISGILTHSSDIDCKPECKASRNEVCQRMAESNQMRCVCRPGFSRMFVDRPCKPTYSYNMKLALDRNGKEKIRYSDSLQDVSSPGYLKLAAVTRDGLDRLVMQSELRDVYQGLEINRFDPVPGSGASETAQVNFHLQ
ncbi:hypothetical protein M8J76_007193, partial [Diaphorina citri]